jgi:hypothetical protein
LRFRSDSGFGREEFAWDPHHCISRPSSKNWFGRLANRPHRLESFLFYKE